MDTHARPVFGMFQDVSSLERAAMALKDAEYRNTAVSVLFPDRRRATAFPQENRTRIPKGPTMGSKIGAVVGGAFGWLTGSSAFTIPGLDSLVGSGPTVATLAGIGAGGIVGGILGLLVHVGIQAREAGRSKERKESGGFLLSVQCENTDWARRAESILKQTGADAVSFSGSAAA
jgi:hypothetical protein